MHSYEIQVRKLFVVSEVKHRLPISIEDASRPEEEAGDDDQVCLVAVIFINMLIQVYPFDCRTRA